MTKHFAILVAAALVLAAPNVEAQSSDWTFKRLVDPMTDKVRGIAMVEASDYTLVVKCDYSDQSVYIDLYGRVSIILGRGNSALTPKQLMIRFDSQQPQDSTWMAGGSDNYLLTRAEQVEAFSRSLMTSSRLVVRLPERYGRQTDLVFPLRGSTAAVANVYRACGRPLPR